MTITDPGASHPRSPTVPVHSTHSVAEGVAVVVLSAAASNVVGATWDVAPEFTVQEVFSNNIRLENGEREDDEFVTDFSPGVVIRRQGKRVDLAFDYRLQGLLYANDSSLNDIFHIVNGDLTTEILPERFFIDWSAALSHQNRSSEQGIPLDNISQSEDRVKVVTYLFRPYWIQRLGNFATAEVHLGYDDVRITGDSDSTAYRYEGILRSGDSFQNLSWEINYNKRRISGRGAGAGGGESVFETLSGHFERGLTRKLTTQIDLGYDNDDYARFGNDPQGILWSIGAIWNPSERTSVDFTVGERYFGTVFDVQIEHSSRRAEWAFSYSEEPTVTRENFLNQDVFVRFDDFGNPITNPNTGDLPLLDVTRPEETAEVLIQARWTADVRYTLRRHVLQLNLVRNERKFQAARDDQITNQLDLSWTWLFGARTSALVSGGYIITNQRDNREDRIARVQAGLTRKLSPAMSGSVSIRKFKRNSEVDAADFDELRVWFALNRVF
jgi:uncharacterized protein (PEP-CTERM system associated)